MTSCPDSQSTCCSRTSRCAPESAVAECRVLAGCRQVHFLSLFLLVASRPRSALPQFYLPWHPSRLWRMFLHPIAPCCHHPRQPLCHWEYATPWPQSFLVQGWVCLQSCPQGRLHSAPAQSRQVIPLPSASEVRPPLLHFPRELLSTPRCWLREYCCG